MLCAKHLLLPRAPGCPAPLRAWARAGGRHCIATLVLADRCRKFVLVVLVNGVIPSPGLLGVTILYPALGGTFCASAASAWHSGCPSPTPSGCVMHHTRCCPARHQWRVLVPVSCAALHGLRCVLTVVAVRVLCAARHGGVRAVHCPSWRCLAMYTARRVRSCFFHHCGVRSRARYEYQGMCISCVYIVN
jgi:hypothetical protein